MIKALFFDLFGTVVDWRGSIINQLKKSKLSKKFQIDWEQFAVSWRLRYQPILRKVNNNVYKWKILDELHEMTLKEVCNDMNIYGLTNQEKGYLIKLWHNLEPWNDSCLGIKKLNKYYITATLSNGNIALQKSLLENAKLKFEFIFSAEHFKKYKPAKIVYLGAVDYLNLKPKECALVASHKSDLSAASKLGLKTIYIERLNEYGKYKSLFKEIDFKADYETNKITKILNILSH